MLPRHNTAVVSCCVSVIPMVGNTITRVSQYMIHTQWQVLSPLLITARLVARGPSTLAQFVHVL